MGSLGGRGFQKKHNQPEGVCIKPARRDEKHNMCLDAEISALRRVSNPAAVTTALKMLYVAALAHAWKVLQAPSQLFLLFARFDIAKARVCTAVEAPLSQHLDGGEL